MQAYCRYFKTVLQHKWFVFLECQKAGIPIRGLLHDLSKLMPDEFFSYARYFEGGKKNKAQFERAWSRHQRRNCHHWQGWADPLRPMDHASRLEMLCDWRAASNYQGCQGAAMWYFENRDTIELHPETRSWVEEQLMIPKEVRKHDQTEAHSDF
jgi:hypothetical protein